MPVWEYKVISSGKGGFASPALLESFLNQLGKEEWEIIHYHSPADNPLAFSGIARRSTLRDWTLEDAAAAAARAETEKLRAEFEAKFKGVSGAPAEEKSETAPAKPEGEDDGFRKVRDTERDLEAGAEEEEPDEWEKLAKEEELPTFFEAVQPLMRRNPKGSGMSVGVDQLAKKWHLDEEDVVGALKECGFVIPDDEDAKPEYLEYDGDLFWVNVNRRGELWVNTKEKPRPVFRVAQGTRVAGEAAEAAPATGEAPAAAEGSAERRDHGDEPHGAPEAPARPSGGRLPEGEGLLKRIRPLMRRGRGGASGSFGFLSRALKCRENELADAFKALGLEAPADPGQLSARVDLGERSWWLSRDQRGGIWINESRRGEAAATPAGEKPADGSEAPAPDGRGESTGGEPSAAAAPTEALPEAAPEGHAPGAPEGGLGVEVAPETPQASERPEAVAGTDEVDLLLASVRPLLKDTRSGGLNGEICALAESLGRNPEGLLNLLSSTGLRIPEKPREKAVEVERGGVIYWLSRNAKDEIWLNARIEGTDGKRPRRTRKPSAETEPTPTE